MCLAERDLDNPQRKLVRRSGAQRNLLSTTTELGADWVANIINAVGNTKCIDEIGNNPWQDTVIFVVWDDWGGLYDHIGAGISPQYVGDPIGGPYDGCLFPSQWGCGYTYGFRVPFMVVSQYTSAGYVSGDCTQSRSGSCPNDIPPYQHDFGSILAFIENNFFGPSYIGQINPQYPFADAYAPELVAGANLPLGDFFDLWNGAGNWNSGAACTFSMTPTGCPRTTFDQITLASATCTVNNQQVPCYGFQYFVNGGDGQDYDPDNDAIDND